MRLKLWLLILACTASSACAVDGHSTNSPAEAETRKFQLAPGLKLEVVASEPLLQNPVAFSINERGQFFIAETHRYRKSIFDITENTPWLLDDLSLRTVSDRDVFLRRHFATNLSILSQESERVRLVEDRDGDGRAETSSVFAEGLNEITSGTAAGVLARGSNVWLTSIPDLWRLTSATNTRQRLAGGLGVHISVSGHDVHGLILGHDGRLYFSFGDRGVCVTNREGVVLNVPDTGGVLRCDPDGSGMEIFCTGLRNPQELAFDDFGNLWTVDNDTAGADPCRVLHLIEGGDYGWRASYQHMQGFGPWVQEELWRGGLDAIPAAAGTVSQGPAGLAFFPGTSTAPQLAGKFLHADFPGGIWAYDVRPRGASYEVAGKEKILWNCWPTDVDFGPDGSLYVLDWVQGWGPPGQGRIYRLSGTNVGSPAVSKEVQGLLLSGMAQRSQSERLQLLGHADRRVRLEAQWHLARMTNYAALAEIALNPKRLPFARLHSIWALEQAIREIRMSPRQVNNVVFRDEMNRLLPLLKDRDPEIRAQACQLMASAFCGDAQQALGDLFKDPSPRVQMFALRAYAKLFQHRDLVSATVTQSRWVRAQEQVRATVRGNWGIASQGFQFPGEELRRLLAMDPKDNFVAASSAQLFFELLRAIPATTVGELTQGSHDQTRAWSVANLRAAQQLGSPAVARFLTNADPLVVLQAARAINDTPITGAYGALAALLGDRRLTDPDWGRSALTNLTPAGPFSAKARSPREQVMLRVLNAHYRLGGMENAKALVTFTANTNASAHLRTEALFLLGRWQVLAGTVGDLPIKPSKDPNHGSTPTVNPENWPGWFDRVVGLWRPLPERGADSARTSFARRATALIQDNSTEVASAAIDTAVRLELTDVSPAIAGLLTEATPVALRRQVPAALATLQAPQLGEAVEMALVDSDASVRASALPHLARLNTARSAEILGRIVKAPARTAPEIQLAQAALRALGKVPGKEAHDVLVTALGQLKGKNLPPALELDLLEAATQRTDPALSVLLQAHTNRFRAGDALAPWRPALHGGDASRGRSVFFEKAETQCARCHQVKKEGGIVGPALDGIARRLTREQLLEAVVLPNATIASGYENVTLVLKNGATVAGLVKKETSETLELESPEEGAQSVARAEIAERHRGLSAMPDGITSALSPYELRDLLEFLATLK